MKIIISLTLCFISYYSIAQITSSLDTRPSKSLEDTIYYKRFLLLKLPHSKGHILNEEELKIKMARIPEALVFYEQAVRKMNRSITLEYLSLPIALAVGAASNSPEAFLIAFVAVETVGLVWFKQYRNYERKAVKIHNDFLKNMHNNE